MPTWVASSAWSAWMANCGPYTGPISPFPAPPPGALAAYGVQDEVDYYLSASPDSDVVGGTDVAPDDGSYRYWSSPTTQAVAFFGGTGAVPSGNLWVIYYPTGYPWPTAAPTIDPLSLVPAGYVAGALLPVDWVDCTSTGHAMTEFAADMGVYVGPWPLLPPGVVDGCTAATDRVDFVVALPNPSNPSPAAVGDGTYATAVWTATRSPNPTGPPSTTFNYFAQETGGTSPIPSTLPSGAHLYVNVKIGTTPTLPSAAPSVYVPLSYSALGAAAFKTAMGTWSTDQAAFDKTTTITATSGPSISATVSSTTSSDVDVNAGVDALIPTLLAAAPGIGSGAIRAEKQNAALTGPETFIEIGADSIVNNVDATAAVDPGGTLSVPHAVLDPLVYDLDYSPTPYIDADGNPGNAYAFDTAPTPEWSTVSFSGGNDHTAASGGTLAPDYTDFAVPFRYGWAAGSLVPGVDPAAWTRSGTTLGDFTGAVSTGNLDVDVSSISVATFYLYWAPKYVYTGAAGATNFALPSLSGEADYVRGAVETIAAPLPLTVHFPTWKYWIPGAIVSTSGLFWHTVGGHWATPGGATMRIQTPGVGWVDVVDGPA